MKRFINYVQESWTELGKVTWPNRQEAIRWSIGVIIFSLVVGAFIAGLDYLLNQGLQQLLLR